MLASLTKLEEQAAKVGESDIHLKLKYNKQEKVLASIKAEVTQARTAYNTAIQNAVTARQHALPPFTQLTPVLAHAIQLRMRPERCLGMPVMSKRPRSIRRIA